MEIQKLGFALPTPSCVWAKIEIANKFPADPGRNRPKTQNIPRKMTVRTLPGPPGGRGGKNKLKSVLSYSWATISDPTLPPYVLYVAK